MQITIESNELKTIFGEYLKENPVLVKSWITEIIYKLYLPENHENIVSDEDMDISEFKKKYAVRKNALKKLQALWQEEAPAQELINLIKK